jgi:3-hydroxybutyryl-CoA dehydratase
MASAGQGGVTAAHRLPPPLLAGSDASIVRRPGFRTAALAVPAWASRMYNLEELHGYFFEDLKVGQTAIYARTITETDIILFAGITGDNNPVHINEEFASNTMFSGRIAHGMLTASFISTVLGVKLPGPGAIYVSQTVRFKAPVRAGDTLNVRATITDLVPEKRRATLSTVVSVGNKVVLEGEAVVIVPLRASLQANAGAR